MSVLGGVRVVDASSGVAGPAAAMFLADFGADVVKVEPPDGDPSRRDPGFAVWNRGKRSVIADPSSAEGRRRIEQLVRAADVCVVGGTAAQLAGGPLDPDGTTAANPRLVHLHLPAYLPDACWAGGAESEQLLAARTGVALRQASIDDVPVDSVYRHLVTVQAVWGAAAAAAALVERERSGLGQRVVVGGLHAALVASAAAFTFDPTLPEVTGRRPGGSGGAVPFYRTYQCGDGEWLFLAALTPRFTALAFSAMGLTDLPDDPRLEGKGRAAMLAAEHAGWVIETIAAVFRTAPRDVWLERLAAAGCPCGPLLDRDDWLDHPQLAAIGMRVEVDDPDRGRVVMPGVPLRLTASPGAVAGPAPLPGDAGDGEVWLSRDEPAEANREQPPASGAPASSRHVSGGSSTAAAHRGQGPLSGVRILDLGAIIAGPFAGSLLAELGADVVKVEPPTGDSFRGPGFAAYNRGQRGVALDLQHPDGRAALLELVRSADVVIDNYRPGVLGRLRLRHDDLADVNPRIVTLSITGFGEGGAMGDDAGFDPVLQAMSGMMRAQGGDDEPVFFTVPVNDVTAAAASALTVVLALFHRHRTGAGQRAWTSLAAMATLLQAGEIVRFDGRPPARRGGTDFPGPAADDRYHRVADGWVRAAGAAADPSWRDRTRADLVGELAAHEVPAAPAQTARELVTEPQAAAAGAFSHDPRPGRGHLWTTGRQARFSRTERTGTLVAPALGEHTREVLLEAGLDAVAVEDLVARGVAVAR